MKTKYKEFLNERKEMDYDFINWIGKNHYKLVNIYSKYDRNPDYQMRYEIFPDYDTFVAEKWTDMDDIPEIMADNNNEELDWILENTYTTEELYQKYLDSKK